ncbi:MAG TPA: SRPBCC domain-containing protein [Paraburkholderia sp.]
MTLAKRFIFGVVGIGIVGLLAILPMHHNGTIETEILIDRPPQDVWQILTATESYPLWNPEIVRLNGQLKQGNVIEFVEGAGSDAMTFHPTILAVQPDRELRWKGYVWFPGIFDGEHRFVLQAVGTRTRFIQSETFTGIFAGTLTDKVLQRTIGSMQAMNVALKNRVERLSRTSTH